MATKKDLVEAHAFSRRRLVTAFVSGAPGGREVEPARPGRTLIGGAALAVLLVAGAAITGIFTDRTPEGWDEPGLLISEDEGASYVVLLDGEGNPEARPVDNVVSARLALQGQLDEPTTIAQDTIDTLPLGPEIGILQGPETLPGSDEMVESGWTACTGPAKALQVDVSARPDATPIGDGQAFVVKSEGEVWVVATAPATVDTPAQAYRYLLSMDNGRDFFLNEFGLSTQAQATAVSGDWLQLFPEGAPLDLDSFDVGEVGGEVPGLSRAEGVAGDYVATDDGGGYVLTSDGPGLLDPFALAVYANAARGTDRTPLDIAPPDVDQNRDVYAGARWPTAAPDQAVPSGQCALLETDPEGAPRAQAYAEPGEDASAADLSRAERDVRVEPGAGAIFVVGDWSGAPGTSTFVVDSTGTAFNLEGPDTLTYLGYGDMTLPVVPDAWLDMFDTGVVLSPELALCPPQSVEEATECA